jgi:hypothetical protein
MKTIKTNLKTLTSKLKRIHLEQRYKVLRKLKKNKTDLTTKNVVEQLEKISVKWRRKLKL